MKSPKRKKVYYGILLMIPVILVVIGCASREKLEPSITAVPQNFVKKIAIEDSDEGKRII